MGGMRMQPALPALTHPDVPRPALPRPAMSCLACPSISVCPFVQYSQCAPLSSPPSHPHRHAARDTRGSSGPIETFWWSELGMYCLMRSVMPPFRATR